MSRKDYEFLASVIANLEVADRETLCYIALRFGLALEDANENFALSKFLRACGAQ